MKYQILNADEIEKQFPFKELPKTYKGIWAPDNGCINVSLVIETLRELCTKHGVHILEWADVKQIKTYEKGIEVIAMIGDNLSCREPLKIPGERCAITVGAYINHILEPSFNFKLNLDIWQMASSYFSVGGREYPADPKAEKDTVQSLSGKPFKSMWFQFENNDDPNDPTSSNLFYGFPALPWGTPGICRIAVDNATHRFADPNDRRSSPATIDVERARRFVSKHVQGVVDISNNVTSCLQTNVYDNMYVLDYLPREIKYNKNVVIFTAGWAFKLIPLIGLIIYQMLWGKQKTPKKKGIDQFKLIFSFF
eukprot:c6672_g1_i1.p1 GENE.c6672_g1_i1~~c6672_g1_i1.p1  ORF type:complete len:309 (+),score=124.60 c6672_g1_i1:662-1588(+)